MDFLAIVYVTSMLFVHNLWFNILYICYGKMSHRLIIHFVLGNKYTLFSLFRAGYSSALSCNQHFAHLCMHLFLLPLKITRHSLISY